MISDEDVDLALSHLRKETGAKERAELAYLESYGKHLKAILMKEFPNLPANAQEREAYAHPKYVEHLEKTKQAVYADTHARSKREAAIALIDAWRTQQASQRGMERLR